ncbi:unnamed protein product [Strongylus vulgaris]|uniref:Dolichyl-diphosphooligosaccharide--protein glycosyltransferase subunit 2 n=1 Tax=Strongylus vulgaris TaxID=40348 RepID=A0A3P7J1K2_STRVU|nr:unnamed protein product [Strongylus vulgaris]
MKAVICLSLVFPSLWALSLNSHWDENDTKWLSGILEDVLETNVDSLSSLHFAAGALKILKVTPSADAAKQVIEGILAENAPSGARVFQALYTADLLNVQEQILMLTNYLLSRKHISTEKSAFYVLKALKALADNSHFVPVVISRDGPLMFDPNQPIRITVTDVFGLPTNAIEVHADVTAVDSDHTFLSDVKMEHSPSDARVWTISVDKIPKESDYYMLKVKVATQDVRLVGTTANVLIKRCNDILVDNFKLGIFEKDEAHLETS